MLVFPVCWHYESISNIVNIYIPYFPAHKAHFFPEKCDLNSTCVLCAEESIISKLLNTRTSIIHLYREIVKTTMKMILVAVRTIFWVSMMNKLYYGC